MADLQTILPTVLVSAVLFDSYVLTTNRPDWIRNQTDKKGIFCQHCELVYTRPTLSLDGFRYRVKPCRPSPSPPQARVRKTLLFSHNGYLFDYKEFSFGPGGQRFPTWLAETPSYQWVASHLPSCLSAPHSHHCGHCPSRKYDLRGPSRRQLFRYR